MADEDEWRLEVNVFDRVGFGFQLGMGIETPLQKFNLYVDAIARKLSMTNNDILFLLEKSDTIKNVKYKNPAAYVLGYLASLNSNVEDNIIVLDNITVQKTFKQLHLTDDLVGKTDVIRYARWWSLNV